MTKRPEYDGRTLPSTFYVCGQCTVHVLRKLQDLWWCYHCGHKGEGYLAQRIGETKEIPRD